MKKIFIAFVAVACALSACSDDDTADDLSRATISITPDAIPAGPDGTTTQVTSNYVYHNIAGKDKQALLLETLRVLKKAEHLLSTT